MLEIKAKLEIGSQRHDEFSFNGGNVALKNSQRSTKVDNMGGAIKASSQNSPKKAEAIVV